MVTTTRKIQTSAQSLSDYASETRPAVAEQRPRVHPSRLRLRARQALRTSAPGIRQGSLALIDQALVSGVSFATTVVLGRLAGPEELGLYSLGITMIVVLWVAQDALISTPFTIFRNRLAEREQTTYAGSVLVHQIMLSALAALAIAIGAATAIGSDSKLTPVLWVVAAIVPFALFREFCRRISVAHLRFGTAVVLDAVVAATQLTGLLGLALLGSAYASSAFAIIGIATAAASIPWLLKSRPWFDVKFDNVLPDWRKNWKFGRWVFAGRMMARLNSDVLLIWLLTFTLGRASAGLFAACMSIVFIANPFILGAGLFLTPKIAHAYARGGRAGARRSVTIATVSIASGLVLFVGLISVAGGDVMQLAYGNLYTGHGSTLTILAVAIAVGTLGMGATSGLLALERPGLNFRAAAQGTVVMLVGAALLMKPWGLFGAACSLLLGQAMDAGTRLIAFYRATAE